MRDLRIWLLSNDGIQAPEKIQGLRSRKPGDDLSYTGKSRGNAVRAAPSLCLWNLWPGLPGAMAQFLADAAPMGIERGRKSDEQMTVEKAMNRAW